MVVDFKITHASVGVSLGILYRTVRDIASKMNGDGDSIAGERANLQAA